MNLGLQFAEIAPDGEGVRRKKSGCLGCLGWFAVFVLAMMVLAVVSALGADDEIDEDAARVVGCKNLVEENLRSPSSAKFIGTPVHQADKVSGEVDAENGFGATIRSEYQCSFDGDLIRLDFIRQMGSANSALLTGRVDIDETFFGGPKAGFRGRGALGKTIVTVCAD